MPLLDGKAETIENALVSFMEKRDISFQRLWAFGSDGASVMTGHLHGVGKRMKDRQPFITAVHCVCHVEALACSDSSDDVPYLYNHFMANINQLYYHFQYSSVRTAKFAGTTSTEIPIPSRERC
jgi:hypothetical protein